MPQPVLMAWSGGKDSALALQEVLRDGRYRVVALVTTVTAGYDRISMHGVRRGLLHRQAHTIGLPLHEVLIPRDASNADYERQMEATLTAARTRFATLEAVVFGDLFLADIRAYRERMLARIGMRGLFPLWLRDTRALAADCVRQGYKAVLVCVDSRALPGAFAGREYDAALLNDLPPGIDPCGENGEFHTFVYAGPILRAPVPHRRGEIVVREGRFVYCDLEEIPTP